MPSTKKGNVLSQLKVGIFAFVALATLGLLILNSTGDFNPFQKKMKLKARFATADGLREGGQVQLAGINIGKVETVRFLPPDSPDGEKIEAVMSVVTLLDGAPITDRIRTDSTAQLVATSVVGNDKMINITPGSLKGIPVSENHVLPSTSAVSINQLTQTGSDLLGQVNKMVGPTIDILNKANRGEGTMGRLVNDEALYNSLNSSIGEAKLTMVKIQTLLDRVKSGDGTAGKILNDPSLFNNLNSTLRQLESISVDLRAGKGTAGKFLTDEQLYNEVRGTINEARVMLADVKLSINRVNEIADDVKIMTKDLNEGKGTAGKFLKDDRIYNDASAALNKFNTTAEKIDLILTDIQAGKGTAGKILKDETLYNNINQTTANVNQLSSEATKMIYDFRQNPKKYLTIQFKLF